MAELLSAISVTDENVVLGPGPGLDCAVLDLGGDRLLVLKSDPITFSAGDLGWYLVHVNANDIATTGATPRWLLATLLFPEAQSSEELVRETFSRLIDVCATAGISIIGGHTEVTKSIKHPIAVGTLIGDLPRAELVTPLGAAPGDILLLTKFVPIEAVSVLCFEFPDRVRALVGPDDYERAKRFHVDPGISVLRDAQVAKSVGTVNAMHDPTEGGLASALWELSDACGNRLVLNISAVPVSSLASQICTEFRINPLAAISSGALLLSVPPSSYRAIKFALRDEGISCTAIGRVETGDFGVWYQSPSGTRLLKRPERDEVARLFGRLDSASSS
jgi:hydrogenase maturation factor